MAAPRLSLLLLALLGSAQARELPPAAYQQIARQAGIPADVLYAIALQESALKLRSQLRPWPWTLNVAGQPRRFGNQHSACHALHQALATISPTRIDIGLAQINWGYHHQRFSSPCAALRPTLNLTVAAHLLREHHRHTGDWLLAAGRYHRPAGGTPATRYRAGVARHLARLQFPLPLAPDAHP
jgi:soluble lytic murein transglycosylase-like protein